MGPFLLDPEGADFARWLTHFKDEVYGRWTIPESVGKKDRLHADIEFVVARDGRLTGLRFTNSSGHADFDKSVESALRGSRFLALPDGYPREQITMSLTFYSTTPNR